MNGVNELTNEIIGAAIEVHRTLGPGLLESTYEGCLLHELAERELYAERQKALPVVYKGFRLWLPASERRIQRRETDVVHHDGSRRRDVE